MYNYQVGRFTGIDKMADAAVQSSLNPYHFCADDPANSTDPTGLFNGGEGGGVGENFCEASDDAVDASYGEACEGATAFATNPMDELNEGPAAGWDDCDPDAPNPLRDAMVALLQQLFAMDGGAADNTTNTNTCADDADTQPVTPNSCPNAGGQPLNSSITSNDVNNAISAIADGVINLIGNLSNNPNVVAAGLSISLDGAAGAFGANGSLSVGYMKDQGFFLTFQAGNSMSATGDLSLGVSGFAIAYNGMPGSQTIKDLAGSSPGGGLSFGEAFLYGGMSYSQSPDNVYQTVSFGGGVNLTDVLPKFTQYVSPYNYTWSFYDRDIATYP